jgi:cell division protease FtsH
LLFWVVLLVVGILIWQFSFNLQRGETVISFTEFKSAVTSRNVKEVTMSGNEVVGEFVSPQGLDLGTRRFRTYSPNGYEGLANHLEEQGVKITARPESRNSWGTMLLTYAPILLMVGFFIFVMRQMQSGGNKALSFGKSRA